MLYAPEYYLVRSKDSEGVRYIVFFSPNYIHLPHHCILEDPPHMFLPQCVRKPTALRCTKIHLVFIPAPPNSSAVLH